MRTGTENIESSLKLRNDLHLMRKVWHMVMGVVALGAYYSLPSLTQRGWAIFALSVAFVGLAIDLIRIRLSSFNNVVLKVMKPFLRESEKDGISGLPYYALGISLSLFFYEEKIAILSIFFLVFSDPLSSLFGILYGKDKLLPGKSLQGSLAGFVTCYVITLFYGLSYSGPISSGPSLDLVIFALLGGFIGSISELFSIYVDDNLTIPVLSGLGLTFLNKLFFIF